MIPPIFQRFVEERAIVVMTRASLERLLSPDWVDEVFERTTQAQYTRELLFSSLFELMARVVFRHVKSVRQGYEQAVASISVSLTSVYKKLQGVEPGVCAALVRESADRANAVIDEINGHLPSSLEGYPLRIVDGNCLAATQRRIKRLRTEAAGPLPGKSLVVYDGERGTIQDVIPCEDGHAQERSLFRRLLPLVQPGELWIEDRNFCTLGFLGGVVDRGAFVLVREHAGLPMQIVETARRTGKTPTGSVSEGTVEVRVPSTDGESERMLTLRRVLIQLNGKTRDGDWHIALLTNLPKPIKATKVANLYRDRWRIETAFQHLQRDLHSEIATLGYPRAALFGFCVALIAYNVVAIVHASLRAAHGTEKIEQEVSRDYVARDLESTYGGMMVAIPLEHWKYFATLSDSKFGQTLLELARRVNLNRYPKAPPRKRPRKAPPKRTKDPKKPHVSTARLLAEPKKRK